jgi:hypothetical protein
MASTLLCHRPAVAAVDVIPCREPPEAFLQTAIGSRATREEPLFEVRLPSEIGNIEEGQRAQAEALELERSWASS